MSGTAASRASSGLNRVVDSSKAYSGIIGREPPMKLSAAYVGVGSTLVNPGAPGFCRFDVSIPATQGSSGTTGPSPRKSRPLGLKGRGKVVGYCERLPHEEPQFVGWAPPTIFVFPSQSSMGDAHYYYDFDLTAPRRIPSRCSRSSTALGARPSPAIR